MLMMFVKGTSGEICHAMHMYAKKSNKYMKIMTATKNYRILCI